MELSLALENDGDDGDAGEVFDLDHNTQQGYEQWKRANRLGFRITAHDVLNK